MKEIILTAIVTAFTTATIMAIYYHSIIKRLEDKLMEEKKKRVENEEEIDEAFKPYLDTDYRRARDKEIIEKAKRK